MITVHNQNSITISSKQGTLNSISDDFTTLGSQKNIIGDPLIMMYKNIVIRKEDKNFHQKTSVDLLDRSRSRNDNSSIKKSKEFRHEVFSDPFLQKDPLIRFYQSEMLRKEAEKSEAVRKRRAPGGGRKVKYTDLEDFIMDRLKKDRYEECNLEHFTN